MGRMFWFEMALRNRPLLQTYIERIFRQSARQRMFVDPGFSQVLASENTRRNNLPFGAKYPHSGEHGTPPFLEIITQPTGQNIACVPCVKIALFGSAPFLLPAQGRTFHPIYPAKAAIILLQADADPSAAIVVEAPRRLATTILQRCFHAITGVWKNRPALWRIPPATPNLHKAAGSLAARPSYDTVALSAKLLWRSYSAFEQLLCCS